jgi:transcriptional regulator with XRE-family HTH domain
MFFAPAKCDPIAWVLGEKIRTRRLRLNGTLDQSARVAGISGSLLSQVAHGPVSASLTSPAGTA